MIPIKLLFNPPSIIRNYPIREWRDVTLWLKWGIILSLLYVIVSISMLEDPASESWIFETINFLEERNDSLTIPFIMKFGLFFIIESILMILIWILKSVFIIIGYNLVDAKFPEPSIAFSIAGASMVTGIWWLIPFGSIFMVFHSLFLISYLMGQIHRISLFPSLLIALPPSLIIYVV